jgi:hypothetical protein
VTKTSCESKLHDPARNLEARDPRHLDVEHDEVRLLFLDHTQRFDAVAGLPDHIYAPDLLQEEAELLSRELLIVDDHGPERSVLHVRR